MNSNEYEMGFIEGYKYATDKFNSQLRISDIKKGQFFKLKRNMDGEIYLMAERVTGYRMCVSLNGQASEIASSTHVVLVPSEEIDFLKYCIKGY
jgi:hypothetical protein